MKRKTKYVLGIVALAIVTFALIFASCASKPPAPEPTPAPAPTPDPEPPPPPPPPAPAVQRYKGIIIDGAETHTVVFWDTLSRISRRYYGNGFYFPVILLASEDVTDHDVIHLGMRLTIPDLQRNLDDPEDRKKIKSYLNEFAELHSNRLRHRDIEGLRDLASSL
jgi:hypothetical protein